MTETFLTIEETANLLRLSTKSVYFLVKDGQLPGAAKFRNQWWINREMRMEWIARKTAKSEGKTKTGKGKKH